MTSLLHADLTGTIIGAYYEVYNHTLRAYPESVFERAMLVELGRRGQKATQQNAYRILYKGQLVGIQQLDLFVLDEVVVELKVAERLTALHKAQGLSYLKTVGKPVGLILNFGGAEPEFDLLVEDKVMVFPVAYQDQRVVHLDVLKAWMSLCNVQLGIMANFQANRLAVTFLRT